MKNLDLNKFGVQEMKAEELTSVEGGDVSIIVIEGLFTGGPVHLWLFGIQLF